MVCRLPASRLLGLLLFVVASTGCSDTTGVYLSIYGGSVVADRVRVVATTPKGTAQRDLPLSPSSSLLTWPVSLVATFPADIGSASFTVTAFHGDVATGAGSLGDASVPPHSVVSRDLTLGSNGDGGPGGGDDGGSDDAAPPIGNAKYTRSITVPRRFVSAASGSKSLTDYPLLLSLSNPAFKSVASGGHVARDDGGDLRFSAADGTCGVDPACALDYELEHYDPNAGIVIAWVRIPSLGTAAAAGDTSFTVGYGTADPGVAAPDPHKVWDPSFRGVWHLDSGVADSTAGAHNGTATGTSRAPGQLAGGLAFNGTSDFVDVASSSVFDFGVDADFTVSLWVKSKQAGAVGLSPRLLSRRDQMPHGVELLLHSLDKDDAWSGTLDTSAGSSTIMGSTNLTSGGAWHLVSIIRRGAQLFAYEDLSPGSPMTAATGSLATTVGLRFGAAAGATPSQFFAGSEDEIRISSTARSQEWMLTDFNLQSAPPNTLVLGSEITH